MANLLVHVELRNLRKAKGMTLKDVAKSIDKSVSYVSRIESGKQKIDAEMLTKLSELYDTSLDELLSINPVDNYIKYEDIDQKISICFLKLLENYLPAKEEEFKNHWLGEFVRETFPNTLGNVMKLDNYEYKVSGSVGQGQWAEVPWISLYLKRITTSATKGYYIVYLFDASMRGFYISLNQGWTYYKENYGTKGGRQKISQVASFLRERLNLIPKDFSDDKIDLQGRGDLSLGYEAGHICGKYYSVENLNSRELINDLNKMLIVYKELDSLIGEREINEFNDYVLLESNGRFIEDMSSISFEQQVEQEIKDFGIKRLNSLFNTESISYDKLLKGIEKPEKRPNPILDRKGRRIWPRDAVIAAASLMNANYKCAVNESHRTFTSKKTGEPYMEAHHLVPMKLQNNMSYKLDKKANILCLCPSCHRLIHYGKDSEREKILEELFFRYRPKLERLKIEITLTDLKRAYNIEIDD